ncbi:hypothetical protein ACOTVD_09035 [Campylobacter jejuni]|uniref:hypothetical protein n=1 Tax=Campylobacter jejuni TaxID=197 RepID=UPI003B99E4AE
MQENIMEMFAKEQVGMELTEAVEIPLKLYCELANISERTAYYKKKNGSINVKTENRRNVVLVPRRRIFIVDDEFAEINVRKKINEIKKRRNKKIYASLENLSKEIKSIMQMIDCEAEV